MKWYLAILIFLAFGVRAQAQTQCTVNCQAINYTWQYPTPGPGWPDCGPKLQTGCFKGFQLTVVYNLTTTWTYGTGKLTQGALSWDFVPGKLLRNGTYVATLAAVGIDATGKTVYSDAITYTIHYHGKQT